jgi:hypothetical protein
MLEAELPSQDGESLLEQRVDVGGREHDGRDSFQLLDRIGLRALGDAVTLLRYRLAPVEHLELDDASERESAGHTRLGGDGFERRVHLLENGAALYQPFEAQIEQVFGHRRRIDHGQLSSPGLAQVAKRLVHELARDADAGG